MRSIADLRKPTMESPSTVAVQPQCMNLPQVGRVLERVAKYVNASPFELMSKIGKISRCSIVGKCQASQAA